MRWLYCCLFVFYHTSNIYLYILLMPKVCHIYSTNKYTSLSCSWNFLILWKKLGFFIRYSICVPEIYLRQTNNYCDHWKQTWLFHKEFKHVQGHKKQLVPFGNYCPALPPQNYSSLLQHRHHNPGNHKTNTKSCTFQRDNKKNAKWTKRA